MTIQTHSPWQSYQRYKHNSTINKTIKDWLLDESSLTQKLKHHTQHFRVNIIFTGWKKPNLSEAKLLQIPVFQFTFIREVELICDDRLCVMARTVIPKKTLTAKEKKLLRLGTKPLGEYIFNHPQHKRLKFQIAKIAYPPNQFYWGRRSIFLLRKNPLLVTEVFTNHLLKIM
jgi:chorismate--pyruvate lyase